VHSTLVRHAWAIVVADGERQVRHWRAMMQDAFVVWRDRHGAAPTDDAGPGAFGLLGNPYIGRPVQECPPYVCAGPKVWNYFDLLMVLVNDNDPGTRVRMIVAGQSVQLGADTAGHVHRVRHHRRDPGRPSRITADRRPAVASDPIAERRAVARHSPRSTSRDQGPADRR
jgi:hypothetical protein